MSTQEWLNLTTVFLIRIILCREISVWWTAIMPRWNNRRECVRPIRQMISPHTRLKVIKSREALQDMIKQELKQSKQDGSQLKNGNRITQTCTLTKITPNLPSKTINYTRLTIKISPNNLMKEFIGLIMIRRQSNKLNMRMIMVITRNLRSW